jgi:hypothetical protein
MLTVSSNIGAAKAIRTAEKSLAKRRRALLRNTNHRSIHSIICTQRMGIRWNGMRRGLDGGEGIDKPFAVVLTLMATMPGVADVTVTGVVGPAHTALRGAPEQVTVMLS